MEPTSHSSIEPDMAATAVLMPVDVLAAPSDVPMPVKAGDEEVSGVDVRVAVVGNVDSGKSTLVGCLTKV